MCNRLLVVLILMLCCQLACAIRELVKLAGGPDKPHFICGDFNSWPDSPPYQLVKDGHLSEKSLTALQSINSVSQADGQVGAQSSLIYTDLGCCVEFNRNGHCLSSYSKTSLYQSSANHRQQFDIS